MRLVVLVVLVAGAAGSGCLAAERGVLPQGVPFDRLGAACLGAGGAAEDRVFTDAASWSAFWAKTCRPADPFGIVAGAGSTLVPAPQVDFSRNVVVATVLGQGAALGGTTHITKIARDPFGVRATIEDRIPANGVACPTGATSRATSDFAVVERQTRSWEFSHVKVDVAC